jgi:hypothetical protein
MGHRCWCAIIASIALTLPTYCLADTFRGQTSYGGELIAYADPGTHSDVALRKANDISMKAMTILCFEARTEQCASDLSYYDVTVQLPSEREGSGLSSFCLIRISMRDHERQANEGRIKTARFECVTTGQLSLEQYE